MWLFLEPLMSCDVVKPPLGMNEQIHAKVE